MQDLRLVFKRNIEKYTDKKHCNFPYEKINFIHYGRGLGMSSIFMYRRMDGRTNVDRDNDRLKKTNVLIFLTL